MAQMHYNRSFFENWQFFLHCSGDDIHAVYSVMQSSSIALKDGSYKPEDALKSLFSIRYGSDEKVGYTKYITDLCNDLGIKNAKGDATLSKEDAILLYVISKSVKSFSDKELGEFNNISYYHDKMKYICEAGKVMEKNKFNLLLNSIPISFKNYYTVLGPIRCSAAKYQKGEMEKLYQAKVGNQDIDIRSEIFKNFKVGDRISNSDVKERLKTIYYSCGYKKTPKATDLETYFETKHCFVPIGDGSKRSHGFELVSKKE